MCLLQLFLLFQLVAAALNFKNFFSKMTFTNSLEEFVVSTNGYDRLIKSHVLNNQRTLGNSLALPLAVYCLMISRARKKMSEEPKDENLTFKEIYFEDQQKTFYSAKIPNFKRHYTSIVLGEYLPYFYSARERLLRDNPVDLVDKFLLSVDLNNLQQNFEYITPGESIDYSGVDYISLSCVSYSVELRVELGDYLVGAKESEFEFLNGFDTMPQDDCQTDSTTVSYNSLQNTESDIPPLKGSNCDEI